MIIDGKKIAEEIIAGLSLKGATLGVVVSQDPVSQSFLRIKERAAVKLGVEVVYGELENLMECDGIIVQLPHPRAQELLPKIPKEKDVDQYPMPPVAGAVAEILSRQGIAAANKKAVVVGEGRLVGKPVADLLRDTGAKVTVISLDQGSLQELKNADIVVSGAGSPGLIKPEMLMEGVVLIDAGTSEQAGQVVGDCDPACIQVASLFTPVPGGVGPIAVACLFKNLAQLKIPGN